jgi:putative DNA-invertase from lambdoid prophage Rac
MIFTVLGAVAELERCLTVERVKAGLRNARAKGRTLGRPRKVLHSEQIGLLRNAGHSTRSIAKTLGLSASVVQRACTKIPSESPSVTA